jgi:hypothetical protein
MRSFGVREIVASSEERSIRKEDGIQDNWPIDNEKILDVEAGRQVLYGALQQCYLVQVFALPFACSGCGTGGVIPTKQ